MAPLEVRGVDLDWSERGEGQPVLLVHETGVDRAAWDGVSRPLGSHGARAISYDRRGWGASGEPPGYARTTIEEQSEDAAVLLERLSADGAVLAGAGLGAIVALDLAARRPGLVAGAVLVEPPLLSLLPEATDLLAADRRAIEVAAGEGRGALVDLYLSGGLGALASGVERIPSELTAPARERPASLIAEIGSVPAWRLTIPRLTDVGCPVVILTSEGTPGLLRAAAAALAARLEASEHREDPGEGGGPAHLDAPARVAEATLELVHTT